MAERGIDAKLQRLSNGVYDIQIDKSGDIATEDSFDTAIIVSLLSDRRASPDEILESQRRRGWIGNEATPGFEIGSKLWLFEQTRITRTIMNQMVDAAREALEWMVDAGLAISIRSVEVEPLPPSSPIVGVQLTVDILRSVSKVEQRLFQLWDITGVPIDVPAEEASVPTIPPTSLFVNQSIQTGTPDSFLFGSSEVWDFNDNFTVVLWAKSEDAVSDGVLWSIRDTMPPIADTLTLTKTSTPGWEIEVNDTFGTNFIDWELQEHELNEWVQIALVWDGSTDTFKFFKNGVDRSDDMVKNVDLGGARTLTDTARRMGWGGSTSGSNEFSGVIHSLAIWDESLSDTVILELYNAGSGDFDFRQNYRNYQQAPPLHYWVPGLDTTDNTSLGFNYGDTVLSRDFPPGFGITTADLVNDVPE